MRIKSLLAVFAAVLALGFALPKPAEAFNRERPPAGWGETRDVKHHIYYPRYRHIYKVAARTDPYAYRYEPRGYYPYYNSGYWVPAKRMRYRYRYKGRIGAKYRYHPAWGAKKRGYHHRKWHRKHHGRHRLGHW